MRDVASSSHPPIPPRAEDDGFDRLRLLRSRRVGPATYHRLMGEHGSARAALAALPEIARAAGLTDYAICPEGVVAAELKAGRRAGATLIHDAHAAYPRALRTLPDAPPVLWALGDVSLLSRRAIGMVGARNASSLGTRMARRLARDLGEAGFVTISGLARGIDAAIHDASVATGTIAVQAGGVDVIYPPENAELAMRIAANGLRLSEMPMGLQPLARHFPARNRIISGLSRALVVLEAAAKSGSLITARFAADQGREVLAVPGHPFDARAAGCNMLIRDGATLVRDAQDVIEACAEIPDRADPVPAMPERTGAPAPRPATRGDLGEAIIARLGPSPLAEDQLIRDLAADGATLAPALIDLELQGRIVRQAGGLVSLA